MVVKIRRSLGDTGNDQRTIRTVPRFGYRWVAGIEVETSLPAQVPTAPAAEVVAPHMLAPSAHFGHKAVPPRNSRRFVGLALERFHTSPRCAGVASGNTRSSASGRNPHIRPNRPPNSAR